MKAGNQVEGKIKETRKRNKIKQEGKREAKGKKNYFYKSKEKTNRRS